MQSLVCVTLCCSPTMMQSVVCVTLCCTMHGPLTDDDAVARLRHALLFTDDDAVARLRHGLLYDARSSHQR